MKQLIKGKGLNKQGGSVRVGRGGGFSALAIPWETFQEEKKDQRLYNKIE